LIVRNDYIERLLKESQAKFWNKPLPTDLTTRFPDIHGKHGHELTYEDLYQHPALQQALAFIAKYTPSKWLLEQEAQSIVELRLLHHPERPIPEFQPQPPLPESSQEDRKDIYDWARDRRLAGVCLSGGGIRSATFNLGVIQGMAKHGRLNNFDYLSSVSGGGYIHSWLAAWLKRKTLEQVDTHGGPEQYDRDLREAWGHVTDRLTPLPGRTNGGKFQTVWPRQIQWLRRYSNYLTPQVGLFTSDTWSAVAIWFRNVALNQALLIAIFMFILSLPHLFAPDVHLKALSSVSCSSGGDEKPGQRCFSSAQAPTCGAKAVNVCPGLRFRYLFSKYWPKNWSKLGIYHFLNRLTHVTGETFAALLCFLAGTLLIALLLRREYDFARPPNEAWKGITTYLPWLRRYQVFSANLMLWFLLSFGLLMTRITVQGGESAAYPVGLFLLLLCLVWTETFAGGALGEVMTLRTQRLARHPNDAKFPRWLVSAGWTIWLALLGIPAALAGTAGAVAIAALLKSWMTRDAAAWLCLDRPCSLQIVLGTLLFFWLAPLTMIIASGLIGKDFPDWLGEWLGRIRGYSLMMGIGWIFLCGSSLLMPGLLVRLYSVAWIKWPAVAAWAATTAGGVLGGKSSKTSGDAGASTSGGGKILELVVLIGPYVYIAGLVFFLSLILEECHAVFSRNDVQFWVAAIGVFFLLAALLGYRLDINEFSMHSFYRDRLTRCYLGASNLTRSPSPVTGFDQRDTANLQVAHLDYKHGYPGPIPIFCCAMNITLGEDLAWQERKAASFAFTPFYSGYTVGWTGERKDLRFNGFVPTESLCQADPNQSRTAGGPNLATVMAASGAAVSPNWGYHTNPATAFLMTMFDVRLGLWVPNPRRSELAGQRLGESPGNSMPGSPRFAPWWLTSELLGSVSDTSKYVYLTDGGHFDNMGLYELVRRRCYSIVICDAEEDGAYVFEGIGDAIRKCRIDLGAEIDLDFSQLTPNTKSRLSPAHVITGKIRYPETPPGEEGEVIYIKASLTGKEQGKQVSPPPARGNAELPDVPGDVQNYKLQHLDFPHDPTADQWFTESQFESYRRLGECVAERLDKLL
jgi:hypothetical protein